MKIYILRGNPIAIVLVASIFSLMLIGLSIGTLLNGHEVGKEFVFFTTFMTFYNCVAMVAFYIAYKQEVKKSKHSFMSPKKYKRSVELGDKYERTVVRLRDSLGSTEKNINELSDEAIVDLAIKMIESNNTKTSKI